jgi:hypothetical protein
VLTGWSSEAGLLTAPASRGLSTAGATEAHPGKRNPRNRARTVIRKAAGRVIQDVRTTVWQRLRAASGGLLGALTLVGGLTWLLLYLPGKHVAMDATVGLVFAAGGLVLLMPHRIELPGRLTTGTTAAVAAAGTVAGLVVGTAQGCCAFVYAMTRGFPFDWLEREAAAGDSATAQRLARGSEWHLNAIGLAGDLAFWAYAGMLVVVIFLLVRRTEVDRDAGRSEILHW